MVTVYAAARTFFHVPVHDRRCSSPTCNGRLAYEDARMPYVLVRDGGTVPKFAVHILVVYTALDNMMTSGMTYSASADARNNHVLLSACSARGFADSIDVAPHDTRGRGVE